RLLCFLKLLSRLSDFKFSKACFFLKIPKFHIFMSFFLHYCLFWKDIWLYRKLYQVRWWTHYFGIYIRQKETRRKQIKLFLVANKKRYLLYSEEHTSCDIG
ncbi:hypothetical protein ACJX0J_032707, partial [Zea mays]